MTNGGGGGGGGQGIGSGQGGQNWFAIHIGNPGLNGSFVLPGAGGNPGGGGAGPGGAGGALDGYGATGASGGTFGGTRGQPGLRVNANSVSVTFMNFKFSVINRPIAWAAGFYTPGNAPPP